MAKTTKFKLVDKQIRAKLTEGRNYGVSFALAKRKDNELHTVGPISPCREYLNDQIYSENSGRPFGKWGYSAKCEGLLDDELMYMIVAILPYFGQWASTCSYEKQPQETEYLEKHFKKLEKFLNFFEAAMKVSDKTEIQKLEDNRFVFIHSKWWGKTTYLISLYTLLIRIGIEGSWGHEGLFPNDPVMFVSNAGTTDRNHVAVAKKKIEALMKGVVPEQNFKTNQSWHEVGIVNFAFPA